MNRGLAENSVNSELLPNCTKKSTNNARIEYKYLAILVVFPQGQFWLDEVGKVRKFSENSSSWVQPVTRKTSDYLAYMTGNSRQVILPREMVELVLINAAANRIARSDWRVPNNLAKFASWFIKVRKMADDFNNAFRFYRFTIPSPQLDSPVPRSRPYLFHGTSVRNQFS